MRNENKKAIGWLGAAHFITDLYSGFLNPILPFIAAKIGVTMAVASLMVSASTLTSSISQPVFGFIADKWKKRFFIFWGILFASIFLSLVGVADNIFILALFIIVGSMGVSFFHPQATSFVSFFSKDSEANKDMSYYIAMGTLGFSLAPLVSSGITDILSLESLPVASILGVLMAISMFFFVPKISLYAVKSNSSSFFRAFKDIFKNRDMLILIMISVLKSLVITSFCLTLPFLWKEQGYSALKIGVLLFLFLISGAVGIYTSTIIENKCGVKKVFYISMTLVFPLTLLFYLFQDRDIFLSLAFFVLLGYVSFLSVPANMVMAQKTLPQYNSMISGFIGGFCWGIVGLVLPIISLIAQNYGILNVLLVISIIPLLCSYFVKFLPES